MLRVGYAGSSPFVIDGDTVKGLRVDIWRAVASAAGVRYALRPQPSVRAALDAVAAGELDAVVGPIRITAERARRIAVAAAAFGCFSGGGMAREDPCSRAWDTQF